jgi:hypothetical protein
MVMSGVTTWTQDEMDRIEQVAVAVRRALIVQLNYEFFDLPPDKGSTAMAFALAMLFGSGFQDDLEKQHAMANIANNVLSKWKHTIIWRVMRSGHPDDPHEGEITGKLH